VIIVGTTLACEVIVDQADTSGEPGGQTLCMPEPDRWLRAMPAMVGTASMDLTLELLDSTHTDIEDFLAESPPGANGVYVLPFFSPSGERAPFVEPKPAGNSQA
jgi:sugar (pentulose or hexulose) kinase